MGSQHKFEYKGLCGEYAEVYIDGEKHRVRNMDIRHHLDEIPTVTLEVIPEDISVEGEFYIKSVSEEVKGEMCDSYCRYPLICSEDDLAEKCEHCPMDRL